MTQAFRSQRAHGLGLVAALAVLAPGLALAQSVFTHAHLRVPEGQQAEVAAWYHQVLGGELGQLGPGPGVRHHNGFIGTMPNEGMAGDAALSVINHVGVSVADVRATVELARDMGGEIRTEPQPGVTAPLIAHITDPWGGRFELLEDPVYTGVNHVHLFATDADGMKDWFLQVFGGEYSAEQSGGRFHSILYGSVWVHITTVRDGTARVASRGGATDHIGFRVPSLDDFTAGLEASGFEPYLRRPNPPGADLMFFEGPEGLHVEMTEPRPQ